MLGLNYKKAQRIIQNMTGGHKFGKESCSIKCNENQSYTATLPTRKERENNIKEIREILSKNKLQEKEQSLTNSSTIDKSLATKINSLQIEAQNHVKRYSNNLSLS